MRSEVVLRAEGVSKRYRMFDRPLHRLLQALAPRLAVRHHDHWALRDVSFEIRRGESVGIVGRNGSGKSTLLQLLCGILEPTSGRVEARGRISALLELGAGFNPEFSGRENARLNAAVLGMQPGDIERRLPAIAAFADIGEFLDRPVKTYSSGMLVRLAFSVAIHVEPEILVVDEALAVGDEAFQRKCHSRIESMRAAGVTVLFVSHSAGAVIELCERAMLLEAGELLAVGSPKAIIGRYQQLLYSPESQRERLIASIRGGDAVSSSSSSSLSDPGAVDTFDPGFVSQSAIVYGNDAAVIEEPRICAADGRTVNRLARGGSYRYCYRVRFHRRAVGVRFGMMFKTITGFEIGGGVSAAIGQASPLVADAGDEFEVGFDFECRLLPGAYFLNCGVVGATDGDETYLHRVVDAVAFRVVAEAGSTSTGTVDMGCRATVVARRDRR